MKILKINRSLMLNLSAVVGWVNIIAHIIFAKFAYVDLWQMEKTAPSVISAYGLYVIADWLIVIPILGILVFAILLELLFCLLKEHKLCWSFNRQYKHDKKAKIYFYVGLLGNLFPFILPFLAELLFRESLAGLRVIFYGALVIIITSYARCKNKKEQGKP